MGKITKEARRRKAIGVVGVFTFCLVLAMITTTLTKLALEWTVGPNLWNSYIATDSK
jgi:hypothetical protein